MKRFINIFVVLICITILLNGCQKKNSEAELKAFIISSEGTYGWVSDADTISFDFFQDGRLSIQGEEGEATMWESKWSLSGDKLTIERTDLEPVKTETVTVSIDGENLIIGDKTYTRYAP